MLNKLMQSDSRNIYQMLMGGGKTTTITPWLICHHILKGDKVAIIVPEHLVKRSTEICNDLCAMFYHLSVFNLAYCSRATVSAEELSNLSEQNITDLKSFSKILVTSDKSLQYHFLKQKAENIFGPLVLDRVLIFDEIDTILDPIACDFNLTFGDLHEPIHLEVAFQFFQRILRHKHNKILLPFEELVTACSKDIFDVTEGSKTTQNRLYMKKLSNILEFVSKKEVNQEYGLGNKLVDDPINHLIAIPYNGAQNPSDRSRFTDFDLGLAFTMFTYDNIFTNALESFSVDHLNELYSYFKRMAFKYIKSRRFVCYDTEIMPAVHKNILPYCNEALLAQFLRAYEQDQEPDYQETISQLQKMKYESPDMYEDFSFHFTKIICKNYLKINKKMANIGMLEFMVGKRNYMFSGTVNILNAYDKLAIGSLDPLLSQQHFKFIEQIVPNEYDMTFTNAILSGTVCTLPNVPVFNQPSTSKRRKKTQHTGDTRVVVPEVKGLYDISPSIIVMAPVQNVMRSDGILETERSLLEALIYNNVGYQALIDTAGILKTRKAIFYAQYLIQLSRLAQKPYEVIYFVNDKQRMMMTSTPTGAVMTISYNNTLPPDGLRYLMFYDQKSTVGVDFKQLENMIGLVTVNKDTTYTMIAQGAFRLRKLGYGHRVDFCCSESERVLMSDGRKRVDELYAIERKRTDMGIPYAILQFAKAQCRNAGSQVNAIEMDQLVQQMGEKESELQSELRSISLEINQYRDYSAELGVPQITNLLGDRSKIRDRLEKLESDFILEQTQLYVKDFIITRRNDIEDTFDWYQRALIQILNCCDDQAIIQYTLDTRITRLYYARLFVDRMMQNIAEHNSLPQFKIEALRNGYLEMYNKLLNMSEVKISKADVPITISTEINSDQNVSIKQSNDATLSVSVEIVKNKSTKVSDPERFGKLSSYRPGSSVVMPSSMTSDQESIVLILASFLQKKYDITLRFTTYTYKKFTKATKASRDPFMQPFFVLEYADLPNKEKILLSSEEYLLWHHVLKHTPDVASALCAKQKDVGTESRCALRDILELSKNQGIRFYDKYNSFYLPKSNGASEQEEIAAILLDLLFLRKYIPSQARKIEKDRKELYTRLNTEIVDIKRWDIISILDPLNEFQQTGRMMEISDSDEWLNVRR